jgi:hypothetical protein
MKAKPHGWVNGTIPIVKVIINLSSKNNQHLDVYIHKWYTPILFKNSYNPFINVLNQGVVWHARTPHNVWVFSIDHLAHKHEIVHIVNHNLYNIGKPCIYMDCLMWPWIHVAVMGVQRKFVDVSIEVKKFVPWKKKKVCW